MFVYASARRVELKDVPSESRAVSSLWCFWYFLLPERECVQPRPAGTSALQGRCVLSRSSTDVQFPAGDFSQFSKHMSSPFLSSPFLLFLSFPFLPFLSYPNVLFDPFYFFPSCTFFPFLLLLIISFPLLSLSHPTFPFPFPSLSFSYSIMSYLPFLFLFFPFLSFLFLSFPVFSFLSFPFISFSYPFYSFLSSPSFPFLSFLCLTSYKKSEKSLQEDIQLSPNPHLSKCPANRHIESKYLCMHTSPMD